MNKTPTIEFEYQRDSFTRKPLGTTCYVRYPEGDTYVGEAWCHDDDNPVKEVGRKLALSRAIVSLPYAERKAIWEQYFSR